MGECVLVTNLMTVVLALPNKKALILPCEALTLMRRWDGKKSAWCLEAWNTQWQYRTTSESGNWATQHTFVYWPDSDDCAMKPWCGCFAPIVALDSGGLEVHVTELQVPWRPPEIIRCAKDALQGIGTQRIAYFRTLYFRKRYAVNPA